MSYSKIILEGYVGKDPELRYTPQGTPVCNFSLAISERFNESGSSTEKTTTWYRIAAWGKRAETVNQYVRKGSHILVEGRLSPKEYTDRSGTTRTSLEVSASDVIFLDRKGERGSDSDSASSDYDSEPSPPTGGRDDDLPF